MSRRRSVRFRLAATALLLVLVAALAEFGAWSVGAEIPGWRLVDAVPEGVRITPERARVLEVLRAAPGLVWTGSDLARAAGVTPGVLRGMADAGLLAPAQMAGLHDAPPRADALAPALT
ncbi:MAG: hypothetical protein ACK4YP_22285, partial [Myxococcota bacterium]